MIQMTALMLFLALSGFLPSQSQEKGKTLLTVEDARWLIDAIPAVVRSRGAGPCIVIEEDMSDDVAYGFSVRSIEKGGCKAIRGSGVVGYYFVQRATGVITSFMSGKKISSPEIRKRLAQIQSGARKPEEKK